MGQALMGRRAIVAVVGLGLLVLVGAWAVSVANALVRLEQDVHEAWAQVQNVYQRRADLIPNLVETVRGFAAHERAVLEEVTRARAAATGVQLGPDALADPRAVERFLQAQRELSSALGRLLVVVERYPELRSSQNFLALQTQLEGTENRIAVERRRYNEAVRAYNTRLRVLPGAVVARVLGFQPKAFFEATPDAATPPRVKF